MVSVTLGWRSYRSSGDAKMQYIDRKVVIGKELERQRIRLETESGWWF